MQEMLSRLGENAGWLAYAILFLYTLGGGMVALIAAGVLCSLGKLDITACIIIAIIANTLGDTLLFYLSRYGKEQFAPYLTKHRRNIALAYALVRKRGDIIILVQKFLYGFKTLVPIAIGLTRYSFVKFSALNFASAVIWALVIGLASFYAGDAIMGAYERASYIGVAVILAILVAIIAYFRHFTRRRVPKLEPNSGANLNLNEDLGANLDEISPEISAEISPVNFTANSQKDAQ